MQKKKKKKPQETSIITTDRTNRHIGKCCRRKGQCNKDGVPKASPLQRWERTTGYLTTRGRVFSNSHVCTVQPFLPLLWQRWRDRWCLWAAALIWRRFSVWPWSDQSSPERGGTTPCAVCTPHSPKKKKVHTGKNINALTWPPMAFKPHSLVGLLMGVHLRTLKWYQDTKIIERVRIPSGEAHLVAKLCCH